MWLMESASTGDRQRLTAARRASSRRTTTPAGGQARRLGCHISWSVWGRLGGWDRPFGWREPPTYRPLRCFMLVPGGWLTAVCCLMRCSRGWMRADDARCGITLCIGRFRDRSCWWLKGWGGSPGSRTSGPRETMTPSRREPERFRARRFYEAGGWVADGSTRSSRVGATRDELASGVEITEVRYRRQTS